MSLLTMQLRKMDSVSSSTLTQEQKQILLEAIETNQWTEEVRKLMNQVNKEPNPYYDLASTPMPLPDKSSQR